MNDWKDGKIDPSVAGSYIVIGKSMKGTILEEEVAYDSDDGWQIGNNWDILCWRNTNTGGHI